MTISDFFRKFESFSLTALAVMMAVVVFFAMVDLGWLLLYHILSPPIGLVEISQLLELFGMFLLVLIGIELLDTVRLYQSERVVRVEIAIVVAILAIARKVITLDYKSLTSFTLLEVGGAVLAFGVAYYLLRIARRRHKAGVDRKGGSPKTVSS